MRLFIALFMSISAFANTEVEKEFFYDQYFDQIQSAVEIQTHDIKDSKIFTDALWDTVTRLGKHQPASFYDQFTSFAIADRVRMQILKSWPHGGELNSSLIAEIHKGLIKGTLSRRDSSTLIAYKDYLKLDGKIVELLETHAPEAHSNFAATQKAFRNKTKEELMDLFHNTSELTFRDGHYQNGIRLFMFCRYKRAYKCLLLMKDKDNQLVKIDDETPWSHPALGKSKKGLPSWVKDGNTPEGVYTINGVMPEANRPHLFGKFRRLIINFVPQSENESDLLSFLPESAHDKNWWRSGVVARDVGRSLLRIHGTGHKKSSPGDPNHPMRPTLGCIMQRELTFSGVTYKDQRLLLDRMMNAMKMDPVYANETKIHGTLYFIELDQKEESVTLEEMRGILEI